MIKNTLVFIKERDFKSTLLILLSGCLLSFSQQPLTMLLVLLMSCYTYKKGILHYLLFTIALCSGGVLNNPLAIIYFVFALFDFICLKGYALLKLDAMHLMKYWNSAILLLVVYLLKEDVNTVLVLAASYFTLHFFFEQYEQQGKQQSVLYFVLIATTYLLLRQYQVVFEGYYTIICLCLCAYVLPFEICLITYLYFALLQMDPIYLFTLLFINAHKQQSYAYTFFVFFLLLYQINTYTILFIANCLFFALFVYRENEDFMEKSALIEKGHQLYMEQSFYRQLMNYSSVFYDLAKYYVDSNPLQSQMLELMGDALEYNAKVSKHYCHQRETLQKRIVQTLKGYKFQLCKCVTQEDEDKVHIELELQYLYDKELEEVIIPLLEKISGVQLRVVKKATFPLQKDKVKIVLESKEYLQIQTYGKSMHIKEVSGDSFQSFHLHDHVVCMLSDGMGQGSSASKSSSLLIQIMEAMMRCQIPQVECIKMINLFMRSDVFATLDVLSFDRKANMAYLSKSASAPTYLYRHGHLYEMNAHSLPIGIIDNIKADVYEIAFQKEDVFIMASDGVSKEEVEKWVALKRCSNVKNEGINLMNILNDKKRSDDSTVLLAKVC
ncbi:MAG: hypothetical protein EOM50_08485 [Erysipelotrichia bacterium]|nr:hypothetical protein [Erysipelotrichia bacterium]NCC54950.1 hypothetical protein [Erysipelotrichia bacterium]